VSLLFTSYLVVTAVAMLVTGWVSTRLGAKRTLIGGLALIVAFAAAAGSTDSIAGIVGFRAGWGLGNALFIATSLAVIVASASGGFVGAIILYETALGLGIAAGPLLGGELGSISWRGPFYGVSALMAIALIATAVLLEKTPPAARRTSIAEPIMALRHRGLLIMSLTAVCYNWGFFTMLGYAPFPLHLDAHRLGLIFTGWGVLVAIFSVFVAPRLQARFGMAPSLYANFAALAVVMLAIGLFPDSRTTIAAAVIVSGAFIGVNNTLTTQAVMTVSPVPRPVASAAYGFVRFIGGGLAPYVAATLAERYGVSLPFLIGAGTFVLAGLVLMTGHRLLAQAERRQGGDFDAAPAAAEPESVSLAEPATQADLATQAESASRVQSASQIQPASQAVAASQVEPASRSAVAASRRAAVPPIVVAVAAGIDSGPEDDLIAAAVRIARLTGAPVDVLRVLETEVVEDVAVDRESAEEARAAVDRYVGVLTEAGIEATGHVLRSVGDHGDVGRSIARYAESVNARAIAVGGPVHGRFAALLDESATRTLLSEAPCDVIVVRHAPDRAAVLTGEPAA
jgi:MFS family permease